MTTYRSNNAQRHLIFTGSDLYKSGSPRAKLLRKILTFRAEMSWITPYCYAWFRYAKYLDDMRQELAALRVRQSNRQTCLRSS